MPLIQVPLFLTMTLALRGMSGWSPQIFKSNIPMEPAFAYEGIGWIHDLTVPDSIGLLPICLGLISLINIEVLSFFLKMVIFLIVKS